MLSKTMLVLAAGAIAGCAGVDVTQYKQQRPELRLEEYFNGTLDAWGMFQKRDGEVVKRFKVVIDAQWEGDTGVLDERFTYSDGTTQQRIWTITKQGENGYVGTADDVVGEAQGTVSGHALHWVYTLKLPLGDKIYNVTFDDWMYLEEDGVMINRSVMKKFGFRLGEVILFFKKRP